MTAPAHPGRMLFVKIESDDDIMEAYLVLQVIEERAIEQFLGSVRGAKRRGSHGNTPAGKPARLGSYRRLRKPRCSDAQPVGSPRDASHARASSASRSNHARVEPRRKL